MKLYELLAVPDINSTNSIAHGRADSDVESIDFYTELSAAMYRVENELLEYEVDERAVWEFDEWGNLESYKLVAEMKQDGAPDCKTWLYVMRYAGYMIKIIDVIN